MKRKRKEKKNRMKQQQRKKAEVNKRAIEQSKKCRYIKALTENLFLFYFILCCVLEFICVSVCACVWVLFYNGNFFVRICFSAVCSATLSCAAFLHLWLPPSPWRTKNNSYDTIVCVHLFIIMYSYILMKFGKAALSQRQQQQQQHTKILYSHLTRNVVFIKGLKIWQNLPSMMYSGNIEFKTHDMLESSKFCVYMHKG